jgi:receptor protein-tyrosine kinase
MSLIEQATRRLEELKRAGIVLPPGVTGTAPTPGHGTIAGAMARMAEPTDTLPPATPNAQTADQLPSQPAAQPATAPVASPTASTASAAPAVQRRSREVHIDLERLAARGYLVPGQSRTALAEQMRIIKRPLLANARGEGPEPVARANLIQVVSALPGEGKTFVSMNLAMSIAMEVDHSVLLVDADVLRPSVPERYGLDSAPGLLDVLSDPGIDLAEVMLRTNVPKLSLLPAGTASLKSTELLASDAMARLLDELAAKYSDRIILFDAPPLIPTTESRVLASRMGQVVMVVEADATTRAQAAQAYAALEDCPVVLSVLNKSHQRSSEAYGYYYAA